MTEKKSHRRTCYCGYKVRGKNHEQGSHHRKTKKGSKKTK